MPQRPRLDDSRTEPPPPGIDGSPATVKAILTKERQVATAGRPTAFLAIVFACGRSGFMLRLETNASGTAGANPRGAHPAALKGARGAQDEAGMPLARGHARNSIVYLRMHRGARTTDSCGRMLCKRIESAFGRCKPSTAWRRSAPVSQSSRSAIFARRLVRTAINKQEMLLDPKLARPGTLPHALLRKNHQIEELQVRSVE